MRARIYLNGKRITKKKARELFGNEKVEKRIQKRIFWPAVSRRPKALSELMIRKCPEPS